MKHKYWLDRGVLCAGKTQGREGNAMRVYESVAELIGKTPLLELKNYGRAEGAGARILAKLEYLNPAGSAKDRVGLAMIEDAGVVDSAGNLSPFGLLTNNWTAMLTAALYGFVPFLFLPLLSIAVNGLLMGLLAAWYHSNGISLGLYLAGILPHGIFELPALLLSDACGVCLCRNMCRLVVSSPKRTPMVELLCDLLRVMLLIVLPMTVAAAFIEAYVTPVVMALFMG